MKLWGPIVPQRVVWKSVLEGRHTMGRSQKTDSPLWCSTRIWGKQRRKSGWLCSNGASWAVKQPVRVGGSRAQPLTSASSSPIELPSWAGFLLQRGRKWTSRTVWFSLRISCKKICEETEAFAFPWQGPNSPFPASKAKGLSSWPYCLN